MIQTTRVIWRIGRLLQERGISQAEFANLLGISVSHLKNIESGARNPSFKLLVLMANVLDCSVKDLFEEEKIKSFDTEVTT